MSNEPYPEVTGDESAIVPPQAGRGPEWPKKIRTLTAAELDRLTNDSAGRFYWDNKLVNYEPALQPSDPEQKSPDAADRSAMDIIDRAVHELGDHRKPSPIEGAELPKPGSGELQAVDLDAARQSADLAQLAQLESAIIPVRAPERLRLKLSRWQSFGAVIVVLGIIIGALPRGCRAGAARAARRYPGIGGRNFQVFHRTPAGAFAPALTSAGARRNMPAMSPSPAPLNPRDAADDPEPIGEPGPSMHGDDESIFELVPPQPAAEPVPPLPPPAEDKPYKPSPSGRSVHPIGITDLSRMAVDTEGRLYWDDRPVEVRRRILMSRPQIIAASIVSAFLIVGAIGAAIQGWAAALDLACRFGMATTHCPLPHTAPPPARPDIPA
jgi:hypothetical protein